MKQDKDESKSIFVHLDLIDEMAWKDACINTNSILIVPSRDDTFSIRSKNQLFKNVAHLEDYEFNTKYIKTMKESHIETVILLPVRDYNTLAIDLLNTGFVVKILEMDTTNISNSNLCEMAKYISRSKDYFTYFYEKISTKNDLIKTPTVLEMEIINLIRKLEFTKLNHIPFNLWLISMIQLDSGYGEPLLFNFLRRAIINTYNNKKENK